MIYIYIYIYIYIILELILEINNFPLNPSTIMYGHQLCYTNPVELQLELNDLTLNIL